MSWEWEQVVSIDWKDDATEHVGGVSGPQSPALRKRIGTYQVDDFGNVLEEAQTTVGGAARKVVSTYEVREEDWLVGLLKRRDVTSRFSAIRSVEEQPPRRVEYDYDARGLLTTARIEPDEPDADTAETITHTRSPEDGLVSGTKRQAAGQSPRLLSSTSARGRGSFLKRSATSSATRIASRTIRRIRRSEPSRSPMACRRRASTMTWGGCATYCRRAEQ